MMRRTQDSLSDGLKGPIMGNTRRIRLYFITESLKSAGVCHGEKRHMKNK